MICDAKWQDDKNHPFTRKRYCESYIFNYPGQEMLKDTFYSPEEVTNYLIKQANYLGYYQGQIFQKKSIIKDGSTHYIYSCNRKSCDAVLQYRKKRGVLVLEKFRNQHIHKIRLTRKKAKTFEIKQYLMDLPAEDNVQFHLQAVKQKFNLTKQQAKYIKSKLFWRCQTEEELLQRLTQKNVTFRRHLQDDKTTILLICTETMKSNYKKYGDLLCFDITYKLLKKKRKEQKHLGVGFFVGQDQNTRIVLFGMCTITHETTQNFIKLFSFFFEVMEERMPKTILTDDQRTLGTALQKIKVEKGYQYNHMLDWYHKIQAMKRNIKRQFNKDILFPLICKILKEPSNQIFIDILYQIATFIKKQEIMLDFIRDQHKYCLSKVACSFFGFGVSSTRAESMNNLIKRSVSHQTNLGKLVFFVMRVQQRLLNNMKVLNEINMELLVNIKDPEMIYLAKNMEHLAFDQIRQYYEASRQLQIVEIDPITYEIPYQKYDRPYKFLLKFDLLRKCWRCECNAIYKTGLPCSHLVKVIKKHKGSLFYYINPRWIHIKKDSDHKRISRPPIAKNRKRI